jgi:dipeptidyl aminopeptidase/acylaminoacyl peptidase
MMRLETYVALAGAAVLVLYVAFSYLVYRRAFVPARPSFLDDFTFTPFEFQADYEEVELLTADGVNFGAWLFRQPGSPQTVIVSGGHKGQRQGSLGISAALWRKGFNVILYSYRGMPGSDRAPITFGIKEVLELQAVIAFARKRISSARIGLLGYSMGAVVSLLGAAGEPGVQALVLDSPFSDLRMLLIENVRRASKLPGSPFVWLADCMLWLRTKSWMSECSPREVLSSLEPRPLFFIHGGADEITSVNHSRRLYDAYRGPREIWIVQGAPHTGAYFADRPLYVERVAGFFARHLGLDVSGHLRLVEEEEVS